MIYCSDLKYTYTHVPKLFEPLNPTVHRVHREAMNVQPLQCEYNKVSHAGYVTCAKENHRTTGYKCHQENMPI